MKSTEDIVIDLIVAIIVDIIFAFIIKWCWNYVMPSLFGLPLITWFQAFIIRLLASLLFNQVSVRN